MCFDSSKVFCSYHSWTNDILVTGGKKSIFFSASSHGQVVNMELVMFILSHLSLSNLKLLILCPLTSECLPNHRQHWSLRMPFCWVFLYSRQNVTHIPKSIRSCQLRAYHRWKTPLIWPSWVLITEHTVKEEWKSRSVFTMTVVHVTHSYSLPRYKKLNANWCQAELEIVSFPGILTNKIQ